ncbi:MAG: site-2 protease family protein [Candidatus Paceibacterota bacterium]
MTITTTIVFIAILVISVVIHEVAHGYMANYLGDPTARLQGRLTMNPLPHLDIVGSIVVPALLALSGTGVIFGWAKPVPYNPHNISNRYGNALVAAAGPASNLLLAIIAGLVLRLAPIAVGSAFGTFLVGVILINIVLMIFNLVPIPPLDGSKILFDFLPAKFAHIQASLERWGFMILLFFIFFAIELIQPIISWLFMLIVGTTGPLSF